MKGYDGYRVQLIKDGEVSLTMEAIEDKKSGGYTIISPDYPEVVTEGEDLSDGIKNFNDMLETIKEIYEEDKGLFTNKKYK